MSDLDSIAEYLAEFFKEDPRKIVYWLCTENLNLGGASPAQLIAMGRIHIVAKFILNVKEGNLP